MSAGLQVLSTAHDLCNFSGYSFLSGRRQQGNPDGSQEGESSQWVNDRGQRGSLRPADVGSKQAWCRHPRAPLYQRDGPGGLLGHEHLEARAGGDVTSSPREYRVNK